MRILVISDSHGNSYVIDKIISAHRDVKDIFFLGDKTNDIEDFIYMYNDKNFHIVSGNCDFASNYPNTDICTVENKRILFTHGNIFGVKSGTGGIIRAAKERNCDIALFGHTHVPKTEYADGIYIVNPGSCSHSRDGANSYAVIDIVNGGIMPIIVKL